MLEHWLVHKNLNPAAPAGDWQMSIGNSSPLIWETMPGSTGKKKWGVDALDAAVKQSVGIDLTISPAAPADLMKDPDTIAIGAPLYLVCKETRREHDRWNMLTMDPSGNFRLNRVAIGAVGISRMLLELGGTLDDSPLNRETIWLRPDWYSSDFMPVDSQGFVTNKAA